MTVYDLPPINATLNAASTVFIALGWWFIRRDMKKQHIACMITALITSTAFLACYLTYHFAGNLTVKFTHPGIVKPIYYILLLTHVLLAFSTVPLVIMTVIPALRARFDKHRKMGRITMPIWLYVSVTGVIVYFMLYQWFPADEVLKRRAMQVQQQ